MPREDHINRRQMLATTVVGASGLLAGKYLHGGERDASTSKNAVATDPNIQGPFLILSTPFTATGEMDYEVLAKEARFVDWCGLSGMVWPQSNDSIDLLTQEEKFQGMEVLAETAKNLRTSLCLGVQGKNTDEMLALAEHAERLAPAAIISRPLDECKTENDLREYWRALGAVAKRPVILQTTNGNHAYKGPIPSPRLLVELAEEFPFFGYVKEEAGKIVPRMRELLAARPPIRRVFSAHGAAGWLYESRLGTEGVITERAVYADVFACIWNAMQNGDHATARDAYSKFLLMMSITNQLGGLRGAQLYLWKKRGVFKTTISRRGPRSAASASPKYSDLKLPQDAVAELEYRFEALKPYLKPGSPDLS